MAGVYFVPAGFVLPQPVKTDQFRLSLLGPEYNELDYVAWTSSMDFIRSLPGWGTSSWPKPMTIEENLRDCQSHLARASSGSDFAYRVLPDRDEVIGCVYFKQHDTAATRRRRRPVMGHRRTSRSRQTTLRSR